MLVLRRYELPNKIKKNKKLTKRKTVVFSLEMSVKETVKLDNYVAEKNKQSSRTISKREIGLFAINDAIDNDRFKI